jgi:hypothetical protein
MFRHVVLNPTGAAKCDRIAEAFEKCLAEVRGAVDFQEGREMAIVRTKLEEACSFAKKAVALTKSNQAEEK